MTNGEKYKSLDDRVQAFRQHCADTECPNCCIKPYTGLKRTGCVDRCILKWLTLEAEEELLACPFCGSEAELVHPLSTGYAFDRYSVVCKECRAASMRYNTKADAIAAWNRRAK